MCNIDPQKIPMISEAYASYQIDRLRLQVADLIGERDAYMKSYSDACKDRNLALAECREWKLKTESLDEENEAMQSLTADLILERNRLRDALRHAHSLLQDSRDEDAFTYLAQIRATLPTRSQP